MHTQPSVFAYSVVFGGAIGTALFSALSLPSGEGFLVGTGVLFCLLGSLVGVARWRRMVESRAYENHRSLYVHEMGHVEMRRRHLRLGLFKILKVVFNMARALTHFIRGPW